MTPTKPLAVAHSAFAPDPNCKAFGHTPSRQLTVEKAH